MKKILLFSFFLMLGLVVSQFLPAMVGESYLSVKTVSNTLLYVCLAFIMINVGREFEMDKSHWRSYTEDYFIALEQWGGLERESFAEPVCSPDFGGHPVYDVGGGRIEIFLGVQKGAGVGDF